MIVMFFAMLINSPWLMFFNFYQIETSPVKIIFLQGRIMEFVGTEIRATTTSLHEYQNPQFMIK